MNQNLKQLLFIAILSPICGAAFAQADGGSVAMTSNKNAFFGADSFKDVVALPGFSVVAPTGMVASWGVAYAGVSGISRAVYSSQTDGAASAGFGFGNAQKFIGGSIDLGIGSINPTDGDAMSRGNIGITLGHFFTDALLGVSVGAKNITGWDNDRKNPDPSYYVAVTKVLPNNVAPVMLNIGAGSNGYAKLNYRPSPGKKRKDEVDVFASVAAYVHPQASVIIDYTVGATSIGTSLVPFAKLPLTVDLGFWNVLNDIDGAKPAFIGSLTYAFLF